MNRKIILIAFLGMIVFTGPSYGQSNGQPLVSSYSFVIDRRPAGDAGSIDGVVIRYTGLENRQMRIFESVIQASTEAECLASRDLSAAVPVGRDRATLSYDRRTGMYTLRWTVESELRDTCRVLLVRSDAGDLAMWQANYGSGDLYESRSVTDVLAGTQSVESSTQFETSYRVVLPAGETDSAAGSFPRVEMLLRKSRP